MNPRKKIIKRSQEQERAGMARYGGRVNPRSGAGWDRKNDGRTAEELFEFKRTDNRRSITLRLVDLLDLQRHALAEGRLPVLQFELGTSRWVVISEQDFLGFRRHTAGSRREAPLVQPGEMRGKLRSQPGQSVLRRLPAQRAGTAGEEDLPGDPPTASRSMSRHEPVLGVRTRWWREARRMGGTQREGAAPDTQGQAP